MTTTALSIGLKPFIRQLVDCGVSNAFHNKELKPGQTDRAKGDSFHSRNLTVQQLIDHIASGGAFTPAVFQPGKRTNEAFVSSELVALDFDGNVSVSQLLTVGIVARFAALVYPTPSSTPELRKSRVVFVLDAAITDARLYREVVTALAAHVGEQVGSKADRTHDPARFFYGSTNRTEDWYSQPDARLDAGVWLEAARAALEAEQNAARPPARLPVAPIAGTRAERWAAAARQRILSKLASAAPGTRNDTIYDAAYQLGCKAKGNWPGIDLAGIVRDCEAIFSQWPDVAHSRKALENGIANSKPEPLELPPSDGLRTAAASCSDTNTADPRPYVSAVTLPTYTADQTVNGRYLSDVLPTDGQWSTLALKSPTGTGKTEWVKEHLHTLPDSASVLVITHRVALVEGLARRLDMTSYRDFEGKDVRLVSSAPQVATTIDSLQRQNGRSFDVVFIDEWEQVIQHLAGAGTLKDRAVPMYEVLKSILKSAKRVIVADAGLTDDGLKLLESLRGHVHKVENTHRPDKPDVTVYVSTKSKKGKKGKKGKNGKNAAIQTLVEQVEADRGVVLIPCAVYEDALNIHEHLQARFPDKRGQIIDKDNSDTTQIKHFVASINEALPEYDWLVYTSSMGTGVDIQAPVAAVVGLFGRPLAPADALQMMNRARNVAARFAYMPYGTEPDGSTDADEIFNTLSDAAAASARHGAALPDASTRGLGRLYSVFQAKRQRQQNAFLPYFTAHIQTDGGRVVLGERDESKSLQAQLRAIKDARLAKEAAAVLDVDRVPTIDTESLDKIRAAGQEITLEIKAGHLRYKIEDCSGLSISEDLYNRLRSAGQRAALVRLASLIDDQAALAEFDQEQADGREPLHRRKHLAAARDLFWHIIRVAFGVDTLDGLQNALQGMFADELADRVAFIAAHHMAALKSLYGWREGNATGNKPIGLFRFILARFGLKLGYKRVRTGDTLTYSYTLDAREMAAMLDIARSRIAARRERGKALFHNLQPTTVQVLEQTSAAPLAPRPAWLDKANTLPGRSALNPFSGAGMGGMGAV